MLLPVFHFFLTQKILITDSALADPGIIPQEDQREKKAEVPNRPLARAQSDPFRSPFSCFMST